MSLCITNKDLWRYIVLTPKLYNNTSPQTNYQANGKKAENKDSEIFFIFYSYNRIFNNLVDSLNNDLFLNHKLYQKWDACCFSLQSNNISKPRWKWYIFMPNDDLTSLKISFLEDSNLH